MNRGILLTTGGSPVLDSMKGFEKRGFGILSCGTCLYCHGGTEGIEAGKPTIMKDTLAAPRRLKTVLKPQIA